jgi:hypothetical protein
VAVQTSAQSLVSRIERRMSIASAAQASAQALQIAAQYMACFTASARLGLRSSPTSGCSEIIASIDIVLSSHDTERAGGAVVPPCG